MSFLDHRGECGSRSSLRDCRYLTQTDRVLGVDLFRARGREWGVPIGPAYLACEQALCETRSGTYQVPQRGRLHAKHMGYFLFGPGGEVEWGSRMQFRGEFSIEF